MIFNRSHYEDVLVVRVHRMVPKSVWSKRFDRIREFEKLLVEAGTHIVKFYLHISPVEQLTRFKERLDDPHRNWKIQNSDYTEREYWPAYIEAFGDAMRKTAMPRAPWYVIPSNHNWFRGLRQGSQFGQVVDFETASVGLKDRTAPCSASGVLNSSPIDVRLSPTRWP